jgi:hypothetical protein
MLTRLFAAMVVIAGFCSLMAYGQSQFTNYTRLSPNTKAGLGASAVNFNGTVYLAMKGMGNDNFYLSSTTDGIHVATTSRSDGEFGLLNFAPSLAVYKNTLYAAFVDGYAHVYITKSSGGDASSFSTPSRIYQPGTFGNTLWPDGSPTLAVVGNYLYLFFVLVDETDGNQIQSMYFDGTSWHGPGPCAYTPASVSTGATDHAAVGVAAFNNKLYVGMQIGSSTTANTLTVCSSTGISNKGTFKNYPSIHPEGGISAATWDNDLFFGFKGNTGSNYLNLLLSGDGVNFSSIVFDGNQTNYPIRINGTTGYEIAPSLVPFDSQLWIFYTSNDNTHYLYEVSSW